MTDTLGIAGVSIHFFQCRFESCVKCDTRILQLFHCGTQSRLVIACHNLAGGFYRANGFLDTIPIVWSLPVRQQLKRYFEMTRYRLELIGSRQSCLHFLDLCFGSDGADDVTNEAIQRSRKWRQLW